MCRHPLFVTALVLSALLHLGAIVGLPLFAFDDMPEAKLPPPLEARLVPPPPPKVVAKPRPVVKPKPKGAAPSAPSPAAVAQSNVAQSPDAPTATPSPAASTDAPPAPKVAAPYPYRTATLRYFLHYGDSETWVGEVTHQWTLEAGRYVLEQRVEAVGFAALFFGGRYVQRSTGSLGPEGLLPDAYRQEQKGSEERVDFNWQTSFLTMAQKGKTQDAPLRLGTQDLLSMLHQLYFMQPVGQRLVMYVATPRRLETHIVEVVGEEDLLLAPGTVRTLHLKSSSSDGAVLNIWLDRERSLLPVRVHNVNRKGVILDYRLQSMTVDK